MKTNDITNYYTEIKRIRGPCKQNEEDRTLEHI